MRKKLFHRIMDQSGRSLSEMLGVLAVIGVLTLMGVYGFSYAMEKWRENETFDRYSKVVAGARTSRILENEGYWTLWKRNETNPDVHEKRDAYMPQQISMNQVISNIGDDLQTEFIYAPLKGPYNMFNKPTDGSDWTEDQEQEVEIWVKVQNPQAFTVHAINLTKEACKRIVRANLGYSWAYGESGATSYDETPKKTDCGDGAGWCEYAEVNTDVAEQLCQNTVDGDDLVLWFGPYCDTIDSCSSSDKCDSGNPKPECYYPEKPCKTGEFCDIDGCCCEGKTDEECDSGEACGVFGDCSGGLECSNGCCYEPKEPTPECNEANKCYTDDDGTPVCCGDGESCYSDAQLCCTKEAEEFCYTDDDDIPVCCVNGEECKDGACVWSGEVCDSGNPKPECSSNEECERGVCVDGCCGCLGGASSCSSNEECSSGICNNGCCEPEQTVTEEKCDSGNPKPECGEDASCGEGYYCDIEGCCKKLPECNENNNEELYCISDSQASVAERCNASYCMYATRCVEWGCSTTELLQDGTKAASIASGYDDKPGWRGSDSRGRDREILMEGSLSGKYPYCSLRLKIEGDDRCVVVSYCDEEPVESRYVGYAGGTYAKEMCPACEASYNPEEAVCVGHELKSLSEAVDGVDFLKHFYVVTDGGKCLEADTCETDAECGEGRTCQEKCCKAIGGQCAEDSLQCETDADCTEWAAENPPEGTTDDALVIGKCVNGCCAASCMDECAVKGESYWNNNGQLDCCPAGQAWYNCGSCVTNPIVKDACNVDRIEAKACCAGPSNAPAGCTDTGQWNGKNKANTAVGDRMPSCYTNYPDSNQQCCDMACLADGGGNSGYDTVCCDANKGDVIQGGVCCKAGSAPQSALCCNAMGGTWAPTDAYSPDESGLDGTCCMSPNVAYVKWGTGAHGVTCESCPGGGVSKVHPANGNTSGPQPMTTKYPLNAPVKIETIEGIMCCNGDLPFYDGNTAACCPVGQLVEDKSGKKEPFTNGKCCQTIGDTPYLDTNGKGDCCPNGQKVSPLASSSSGIVEGQCCATGEEPYGDAQCCSSGQVAKGATVASDKCCGQNEKASQSTSGGDGQCCPVGEEPYGDAKCCPAAQLYTDANGDGVCCANNHTG